MQPYALFSLVRELRQNLDADASLAALSKRAGWSRFHLHRAFRSTFRETPKQFILRLRLEAAAAKLLRSREPVTEIALACGFSCHEVFTRAFQRRFGRTPLRFRSIAMPSASPSQRQTHAVLGAAIGPCTRVYRFTSSIPPRKPIMPVISITRLQRAAQPLLLIRRRILQAELQTMLGECFGRLYTHAHKAGLAIAGWPLARYVSTGVGLWTVEAAMPLLGPAAGEGEMQSGYLSSGPVAMGVHAGPYDQLPETNSAIETWIEQHGWQVRGAPWESYVTDPAEHPNPADWRTEVYWPLSEPT